MPNVTSNFVLMNLGCQTVLAADNKRKVGNRARWQMRLVGGHSPESLLVDYTMGTLPLTLAAIHTPIYSHYCAPLYTHAIKCGWCNLEGCRKICPTTVRVKPEYIDLYSLSLCCARVAAAFYRWFHISSSSISHKQLCPTSVYWPLIANLNTCLLIFLFLEGWKGDICITAQEAET